MTKTDTMRRKVRSLIALIAILLWPTPALGDGSSGTFVQRPFTKDAGLLEIESDVLINLSTDNVAKPFAIAPDISYGLNDRLAVGLTHNLGICLSGRDSGCGAIYDDVGAKVVYGLRSSPAWSLAVHGEFRINSIQNLSISLPIGLQGKYVVGKLGVYVDPTVNISLTARNEGNKDSLAIAMSLAYQASPSLVVHLDTGLEGVVNGSPSPKSGAATLAELSNTFAIPLGIGALYQLSDEFDVGASLLFPSPFGCELANAIGFDHRVLTLHANVRL